MALHSNKHQMLALAEALGWPQIRLRETMLYGGSEALWRAHYRNLRPTDIHELIVALIQEQEQQQAQPVAAILFIPLVTSMVMGQYTARMELRQTMRTPDEIAAYQGLIGSVILEMQEAATTGCYPVRVGKQCNWCNVAQACPAIRKEA